MLHACRAGLRPVGLAIAALALAAAPLAAGQPKGKKWWQSEQFQTELGLTAEQVTRIEDVFRQSLPALRAGKQELDRLETELSAAIADSNATEPGVLRLIDRVEASRSALGRTRSLMLFRMYRVLTPEQRVRLSELHESGEHHKRGEGPR